MFGNKYMADELAKNFQARVNELKKVKRTISSEIKKEAEYKKASENAEDYLMDSSAEDSHASDSVMDKSIDKMTDHADDHKKNTNDNSAKDSKKSTKIKMKVKCSKCNMVHDGNQACDYADSPPSEKSHSISSNQASDMVEDVGYLVDAQAAYVLQELGKVASDLRNRGNSFAADMVAVTANDIKKETLVKAAKKIQAVNHLVKMAKQSYSEGDLFTGDVIQATINNIKKG